MFDDLLLLSEGRQIYHGEAKSLQSYLSRLGQPCPSWVTAGEHALNLISVNHESSVTEEGSHKLIDELANEFERKFAIKYRITDKAGAPSQTVKPHGPESSLLEQVKLLFARSWREISRNKGANIIKAVQQVSTALIYGSIYSFSNKQSSIQDRFGLCSLVAIGNTNLAIASTIRSFPKEKAIVMNDRSKNLYRALPYFASKVLSEVPLSAALSCLFGGILYPMVGFQKDINKFLSFMLINVVHSLSSSAVGLMLGAISPSSEVALAMLPPIVVLQIIFNGFNIAEENTPKLLAALPKMSVVRWGFEGLALNELRGLELICDFPKYRQAACVATGEEALARVSSAFEKSSIEKTVKAQLAILAFCYFQTVRVLSSSGPKYMEMKTPLPS
uniref:ABC-2 type transporter transmembrane domain-containing protein n=2 Tax=Guillardia theta TaxID=55529 RepID=A0A7S4L287_GUITH